MGISLILFTDGQNISKIVQSTKWRLTIAAILYYCTVHSLRYFVHHNIKRIVQMHNLLFLISMLMGNEV